MKNIAITGVAGFTTPISLSHGNHKPMISIITPSFNNGKYIRQTIQSILGQGGISVEYIVVDGGSSDGTLDTIRSFGDRLRYISKPDHGQSDAINKGIQMSHGDLIGWLNADDYYHPETLHVIAEYFAKNPEVIFLYGDGLVVAEDGTIIGLYPTEEYSLKRLAYRSFICQPAAFWRRSLSEEIGSMDVSLHYAMDLDFWIRTGKALIRHPEWRVAYIPQVFAYSRMHRRTKTITRHREVLHEIINVVKRYFGYVPFNWVYGIEEVRDLRYDGIFKKSPLNFRLITKSFIQWILQNRTRPDHIVKFIGKVLFSPRKSWQTMVERVK
jgi:Glycosyltransferases involved in cell wall biogenesis